MSLRARRVAERLHRALGSQGPPVNPGLLLAYLPLHVVTMEWPDEVGAVLLVSSGELRMALNARHGAARRHFSFWHEVGHYLLHRPARPPVGAGCPRGASAEREADVFATHMIMPDEWVRRSWEEACHNGRPVEQRVRALARRFHASPEAMGRRLRELGLARHV